MGRGLLQDTGHRARPGTPRRGARAGTAPCDEPAVGGGPVPTGAGGGAAGAGAAGPGRERRRDAAELPLAMGGGCRVRAPPGAGLPRAGLRLLLVHAVLLLCAAGSTETDGSGTLGGGRYRERGKRGRPGGDGTSGSGDIPHQRGIRGARVALAPGAPVPGDAGGPDRGESGAGASGPRRSRGRGEVPREVGAFVPSPLPALGDDSLLRRVPGGWITPIAPGWSWPRQ